jgi:glycosyltransferase involved in cell wall biosynthesis
MAVPSVTFVLPVFNGAPFLPSALASILAQTRTDWRAVVIDDASSDNSREIMHSYRDARIAAVSNTKNQGLYPSLVRAIACASTPWISIVMQDDLLHEDYLENMLSIACKHPSARAAWPAHHIVDEHGTLVKRGLATAKVELIQPGIGPWSSALMRGCFWIISGSLTRRDLLVGWPFRADLPHCGDYEWLLRVVRHAPMLHYEQPLLDIREHPGQASAANLATAVDVAEAYRVIHQNVARYPRDLSLAACTRLGWRRSRLLARRSIAAAMRRRGWQAARLAAWSGCFLALPAQLAAARLSTQGRLVRDQPGVDD